MLKRAFDTAFHTASYTSRFLGPEPSGHHSSNWIFAALIQSSLAAPANASHFSAATLYSAFLFASRASLRASMTFLSALASARAAILVDLASLTHTSLSLPVKAPHRARSTS